MTDRFPANTITGKSGAYSANDVVGGVLRFPNVPGGTLRRILITDKAAQVVTWRLVLFRSVPTTIADDAAYAVAAADQPNIVFDEQFTAATYQRISGGRSVHLIEGLDSDLPTPAGDSLYGYLVTVSGGSSTSTTDMSVSLDVDG